MKGKYRDEIIREALLEYPCEWCECKSVCTIQCAMYKSMHNFYSKLGKTKTSELLVRIRLKNNKKQVLELLDQYNQY